MHGSAAEMSIHVITINSCVAVWCSVLQSLPCIETQGSAAEMSLDVITLHFKKRPINTLKETNNRSLLTIRNGAGESGENVPRRHRPAFIRVVQYVAVCCSVLQSVAVCCSVLQSLTYMDTQGSAAEMSLDVIALHSGPDLSAIKYLNLHSNSIRRIENLPVHMCIYTGISVSQFACQLHLLDLECASTYVYICTYIEVKYVYVFICLNISICAAGGFAASRIFRYMGVCIHTSL